MNTEGNTAGYATEQAIRLEFAYYFLDLQKSLEGDGVKVSKSSEWETFIGRHVAEGALPPKAVSWKCPGSVEAEIRKGRA